MNNDPENEPMNIQLPPFRMEKLFKALSQSTDWGLTQLKIKDLWETTKGKGIKIAVLDTGCPGTETKNKKIQIHPDLRNNILVNECKSFVLGEGILDYQGHGTAVCGTIAAEDNTLGFVGYAPEAKIVTYKVLNKNGSGSLRWIVKALKECIKTKPDIVSMSLGSLETTPELHEAVKKLDEMGIPVICAAGNGGEYEGVNFPARYQESFAIGAYDKNMNIANFSAIGPELDFAFPGVDIQTTWLNNGYTVISGTSFACPACTGLVALIMAKRKAENTIPKTKNTLWIYDELKALATNPKKLSKQTSDWGWGYIDISKLIDKNTKTFSAGVLDIRDRALKYDLTGIEIFDEFTNEEIEDAQIKIKTDMPSYLKKIPDEYGDKYYPAFLIYQLQLIKGGESETFKQITKTFKSNVIKIALSKLNFLNPFSWYIIWKTFKVEKLFSAYLVPLFVRVKS